MVDQVKKWMNTSTKGNPRGHSTLTNHTNSVTMIPNHVEMGEMVNGQKVMVKRKVTVSEPMLDVSINHVMHQ